MVAQKRASPPNARRAIYVTARARLVRPSWHVSEARRAHSQKSADLWCHSHSYLPAKGAARRLLASGDMRPQQKKLRPVRPDEWGFYDPSQAGIAAVIERLDLILRRARRAPDDSQVVATSPSDSHQALINRK